MSRPFSDTLREMSGGSVLDDLTQKLDEAVEATLMTHKVSKVSLEVTIKPNGENSVTLSDKVKAMIPEPARGDSIFFVKDGELTRKDPRQQEMKLRRVGDADSEAGEEAGELAEANA